VSELALEEEEAAAAKAIVARSFLPGMWN